MNVYEGLSLLFHKGLLHAVMPTQLFFPSHQDTAQGLCATHQQTEAVAEPDPHKPHHKIKSTPAETHHRDGLNWVWE